MSPLHCTLNGDNCLTLMLWQADIVPLRVMDNPNVSSTLMGQWKTPLPLLRDLPSKAWFYREAAKEFSYNMGSKNIY